MQMKSVPVRIAQLVFASSLSATGLAADLTAAEHTAIQQLHAGYNTMIDRGDAGIIPRTW